MLYAAMIVCSLATAPDCLFLEDERGPYETFQECDSRNQELLRFLRRRHAPMTFALFCSEELPTPAEQRRVQLALLWKLHEDYPDMAPAPVVPQPEGVETRSSGQEV